MLPLILVWAEAPADAGLGSLVRAAAKLGSTAGKAGSAAKGAGAAAKAGTVAKGASTLGAAVAAERVFAHVADDGARMAMFVAPSADDGLRVVVAGGDEVAHTPASFSRFVDELDEMAAVTPEAGVDLYVDPEALPRLAGVELGPNTRLFLANTEGPSRPLRLAADGVAEVGGGRAWIRTHDVAFELVQLGADLAEEPIEGRPVRLLVTDPDCGAVPGALPSLDAAAAGDLVVVLGPPAADLLAEAEDHGVDLVVPGLADPCPAGVPAALDAALARVAAAGTLGELWAVAAADGEVVVHELRREGARVLVHGAGLVASHAFGTPERAGSTGAALLGAAVVAGVGALALVLRKRKAA